MKIDFFKAILMSFSNYDFTKCLNNGLFYPFLQPIFDSRTDVCCGAEMLARLCYDDGRVLNPSEFLPIVNSSNEQYKLTEILLEKSTFLLSINSLPKNFLFNFNIDANMLSESWLIDVCKFILANSYGSIIPVVEITEHHLLSSKFTSSLFLNLSIIRSLGCFFALDDFGTGWSNFSLLQNVIPEVVKIPKEITSNLGNSFISISILEAMVQLGNTLGFKIIAEGVETYKQKKVLTESGVFLMQGYYFSEPVCIDDFMVFIKS